MEDLANLTFAKNPPDKEYLNLVFNNLRSLGGESTVEVLLEGLEKAKLYDELSVLAYEVSQGKKHPDALNRLIERLNKPVIQKVEFVTDDINEILNNTVRKQGLRWRLDSLNKSLGSLRKGDFGFVFARPETGKTTFLASEVACMAQQLISSQPSKESILWFNNEEQGEKVKARCYQAALGATMAQISKTPERAQTSYIEKTGGRIKIYDSAYIQRKTVEALCHQENPSLIIFDQIDKIKGFSEDREDLVLGKIYQWARELAKEYAPVIGICQANGTAENERWLTMAHVSNATTSKQAEADFIVGIGKIHDPGFENIRFINISKNKLIGDEDTDPSLRHAKFEILIKPEIARYEDI